MAKTVLPMQGAWVRSLVRERRLHVSHCAAKSLKNKEINKGYIFKKEIKEESHSRTEFRFGGL